MDFNKPLRNIRQAGFTLIELAIVVAVAAVLTTVGIPSFEDFMVNQRLKRVSQTLMLDVMYARSEAVKLNAPVYIYPRDDDWNNGWLITTVEDKSWNDCVADMDGCMRLVENTDSGQVAISGGPASVQFGRMGRSTGQIAITVCDLPATERAHRRVMRIELTGHASIVREGKCA